MADQTFAPTSAGDLQPSYQLAAGRLTLDLTELPVSTEPVTVDASVGIGEVWVIVPPNAQVEVDTDVGFGATYVLGTSEGGTNLENHYASGDLGRMYTLNLAAGIGAIQVDEESDDVRLELNFGAY